MVPTRCETIRAGIDKNAVAVCLAKPVELDPRRLQSIEAGLRNFMPRDDRNDSEEGTLPRAPLGQMVTADEAVAVALFLVSDESSLYAVDGGLTHR